MKNIEKFIKLKDACTAIYLSDILSSDYKINIMCKIKSNIAGI